ncbi:flagellar basal-body MS-ring/collar protein FliF [Occultella aeris]|uniref:Flagellar M-ring protein n=1 Tax=Occultella aeris TaxID=2761496 RepID=A0A7M4DDH3_9MICO|nr:flagellar basal-body MS-ring/collar protein FliF [Occultella aeris]VZO34892.1 Flagellar M-ring protein [Occultella aeris]
MAATLTSWFGRLVESVRSFSLAQRTLALIGIAVLVLGTIALSSWLTRPSFAPLFSGLSPGDANTIVDQLRTNGVEYQLADGGSTVLVPEDAVYDQRLQAAAAGLPSSSTGGYSLLDDMGVTTSEFQQEVTYQRAIEGELAATIGAMSGVRTASVRLAIPEETVFVSQTANPTASVFIETEEGVSLNSDQVQAIVHLTSASIDGMSPTDVAVIDATGRVLSAVGQGATGTPDQQASDHEERVRAQVQAMLDQVLGAGNSTVVVAAQVSTESAERLEESFTAPEGTPAHSTSSTTENYTGSAGTGAGVLGPDNIAVPDTEAGGGDYNSESEVRDNALNSVTQTTTIPAGTLIRQSVSVAVDTAAAAPVNMAELSALVATAAGVDAERGDEVTVTPVQFDTSSAQEAQDALAAAAAAEGAQQRADLTRTGMIIAGVLAAVIIALVIYARRNRRQDREPIELGPATIEPIEDEIAPTALLTDPEPRFELPPPPFLDNGPEDLVRKRAELDAIAEHDPERMAEALRDLMDERRPV